MMNKIRNNSLLSGRATGSVNDSSNFHPTLSKNQVEQATLVKKLPNDFPIAHWEQMNTKQQLQAMKYSGLNRQEQWTLLNATAPLSTLNQHNQAQDEVATRSFVERSLAPLVAQIAQPASVKTGTPSTKSSNSTPLQKTPQQRKLDMKQEEYETRFYEKEAARVNNTSKPVNPTKAPVAYKPLEDTQPKDTGKGGGTIKEWIDNLVSDIRGFFGGSTPEKNTPKPVASTPTPVAIVNIPPTITPRMTPPPTPTPKPTSGFTKRQILANEIVANALEGAKEEVPYSSSGRYGAKGFDCSGFVIAMCEDIGSKLPFGEGIRKTCKYGMSEDFRENLQYGREVYNYEKDNAISELQAGDLVFYANPGNLKQDAHVAIATGEMLYDSKTGVYWPQVVEASAYSKKVTDEYPAFNVQEDGQYSREHSKQVVTYVIRPNYDWEEQP